ncbi:nSTAND1 domain-containing NTPase [Aetokthonos hydrillicola]|uniref:nSTAND1 domain-containing NTPase n=1 Tax=Aetokthonos hydrillicola TaxID=1550245 RepID=UPI001ABB38F3|nr:ABC transporter substrate-binding protein [Aetokthonos hydrillicola]MBO3460402.1 ABC transporter substrate-binding protein [Aetokthonos hydrillicola CCALA 1050]
MPEFKNSYAIVIGISKYAEPSWQLKTATNDANKLIKVLRDIYNYDVLPILDEQATSKTLNELLTNFENQIIPLSDGSKKVEPNDRVLFYFAGHGIAIKGDEKDDGPQGFIYPQDAMRGDNSRLLPMRRLHNSLVKLESRHLLIILDCCFAGSFRWVVRQAELSQEQMYLERYKRYITGCAQEVITSSAYNETAADVLYGFGDRGEDGQHSPFAKALLEALDPANEKNADTNKDSVITTTEIVQYIEDKFLDLNTGQTPGYCQLKKHDFGKYLFFTPEFDADRSLRKAPLPDEKDPRYPYKGLLSFEKEDQDKFFGRKRLIEKLEEKVNKEPLTVVLGTSGSGKSSLVKAGLIPKLEEPEFQILDPVRPGDSPITALARELHKLEVSNFQGSKTEILVNKLNEDSSYFADIVGNWTLRNLNRKLLLFIDQFEELVTLCHSEKEQKRFLQQLAKAIVEYPQQLRIVVTLRSDYEPVLRSLLQSEFKEKAQVYLARGRLQVSQMTREELREAIAEPAEKIALFFEGQTQESESLLVDKLIDDVINMPGGLSLLSFTLSELYRKFFKNVQEYPEYNRIITHRDYEELGKVTGSLTKRADEIYHKLVNKNPEYSKIIKHVMLRMVAESSGDLARRRVFMKELEYPKPVKEKVDDVIQEFTAARLLVKGQDENGHEYVEPAHDALVRGWSHLREWLQPKQQNLVENVITIQQRLTAAAQEWDSHKPGDFHWNTNPYNWLKYFRKRYDQTKFLWDTNPYLEVLKKILYSSDNWFNQLESQFVRLSLQKRKNNKRLRDSLLFGLFFLISAIAFIQWRQTQIEQIEKFLASSEVSFNSSQQLEALVKSLNAAKQLELPIGIETNIKSQTMTALDQTVYWLREHNDWLAHNATIRNIKFSPNGQIIASASVDETIKLWDLKGNLLNTLKGHKNIVNSVSFSPNGQILASASYDRTIKLWSINGKVLDNKSNEHTAEIYSVSFSPDGKILASASWDGTVKLWSVNDSKLKLLKTVELLQETPEAGKKGNNHQSTSFNFNGVSFSPDGKLIAAGSEDKKVWIWDQNGKLLRILPGHRALVYSVSFSPDSNILASASADNTIILWNVQKGKQITTLHGHKSDVYSIAFSADGKTLISASKDNTIKFWSVKDGKDLKTLTYSNPIRTVNISPDGKLLASGGIDADIKLWRTDGDDVIPLTGHSQTLFTISISHDGKTVATGGSEHDIKLWRKFDGKELRTLVGHESEITTTTFSPDGHILASGDINGNIILWDPANGVKLTTLTKHLDRVGGLSFSPDGMIFASGSDDKFIKLWDRQGHLIATLPEQKNKVLSISFSPDGKTIASGSISTITLWDVEQRRVIKTLSASMGGVNSLSFSSDGKILASGSNNTTIKLWSIPDGKLLNTLKGHIGSINSVSFRPNSDILASGSDDKTIKIWNTTKGEEITTLKGHSQQVYSVSFSDDGKTLASASADNTALLWETELLNFDNAFARGCYLIKNYPNNDTSIKNICDNTLPKLRISFGEKILVQNRPYRAKIAGVDAFIDGKFTEAATDFQNYLKQNPNDPEALIYKNNAEIGDHKSYTIAVSVPLGSNVNGSLEILRGVALAQNEINLAGGIKGVKLRVLIADDENDPSVAQKVAIALTEMPNVLGVVGNFTSDVAKVTSKVYSDKRLVAIFPVSTSVNLRYVSGFGKYLFRTVPSNQQTAEALNDYMQKRQLDTRNITIFYNSKNDYSSSLKSEIERTIKSQYIVSKFDFSLRDFNAQKSIGDSIKAGAEIMLLLPDSEKLNPALEVLNENAKKRRMLVLGGDSLYSPVTLELGGESANRMIVAVPWDWKTAHKSGSKFTASSQHLWGGLVSWRTATSYDATKALIAALHRKNTREGIAETLQAKDFSADGASGKIQFNSGESSQKSHLVIVERTEGKLGNKSNYDFVPIP